MRGARGLLAFAALLTASTAWAQVMPGFTKPDTLAAAIEDSEHACVLASSNRPMPGINQPLLGMEGEGLKVETVAPDWLLAVRPAVAGVRYASLDTPEGPLWFVFDGARHSCLVAARPADGASLRAAIANGVSARDRWTANPAGSTDGATSWSMRIPGSGLRWEKRLWLGAGSQPVVVVDIIAAAA